MMTAYHETTGDPIDRVLERLERVTKAGRGFIARCPAHDDGRPSLKIDRGDDGRVLLKCYAGCELESILEAIELTAADLFEPKPTPRIVRPQPTRDTVYRIYDYLAADGTLIFQVERKPGKQFLQRRPDGKGGWIYNLKGVDRILYHLPELEAEPRRWVYKPEGEKDADQLHELGSLATTAAGGAGAPWLDSYTDALKGHAGVVILPDNDRPGRDHASKVPAQLHAAGIRVKILALPGLPNKGDVSDWLDAGHTKDDLIRLARAAPDWTPESEPLEEPAAADAPAPWPAVIPLDDRERPPYPADAWPDGFRAMVAAEAEAKQVPADLPAILAQGVISTALRDKVQVVIAPGWLEQNNTQAHCALESGNRKSGVERDVTRPAREYERRQVLEDAKELSRWESDRRVKDALLRKYEAAAASPPDPSTKTPAQEHLSTQDLELKRQALAEELALDRKPTPTRLFGENVAAEKLAEMLWEQRGAIGVISAEGGFWDIIGGRYSNGEPDFEAILKGYTGDAMIIDRLSRGERHIPRPCMTVAIAPQPSVIVKQASMTGWISRGGAARQLPAHPKSTVGYRNVRPTPVPAHVSDRWHDLVTALLEWKPPRGIDPDGVPIPAKLGMSPDAHELCIEFVEWIEPQLRPDAALTGIKDWASKIAGTTARIAAQMHIVEHAFDDDPLATRISRDTIANAIQVARYHIAHAYIYYDLLGQNSDMETAKELWEILRQHVEMSRRDLFVKVRGRWHFQRIVDLKIPLATLEDHGFIRVTPRRVEEDRSGGRRGRPEIIIEVNPSAKDAAVTRAATPGNVVPYRRPQSDPLYQATGTDDAEPFAEGEI